MSAVEKRVHGKASAMRLERFECRRTKKKTRINKGKEKSTKKRQNTLKRCPEAAARVVITQAEREHGPFNLSENLHRHGPLCLSLYCHH